MSTTNGGGHNGSSSCNMFNEEDEAELRRGPWTIEEDSMLIHYIACNGEGRWNMLAKCAGLKRTGKSCRLRWLNYLKPDVKRGNLSPQEQLLILELHAKWGNRWSKIAQHLPGRTDNEIKNFWRTRVQKQARQLNNVETEQQIISAISQATAPSNSLSISSSSAAAAISVQENNCVPVSASPSNHWHRNFLGESSSSSFAPQNQGLPDHYQTTISPSSVTYANTMYTNSCINPFQNEDCYYVNSHHGTSSGSFELVDANMAVHGQVAKSDWVMDDDVANSMWNNTDELWQFR